MTYAFGAKSLAALVGVHPDLVRVCKRAIALSTQDFRVGEGVRSHARQLELYAQGRTRPGPKVTWVKTSNHEAKPDGFGHAVDLWALDEDGDIDWGNIQRYDTIAKAMYAAAKEFGLHIRWGADWDEDGKPHEHGEMDLAHFEIKGV